MDNSTTEITVQKKDPLDSMSRDDLIKKCKQLLNIAQKAKQAKDVLGEENKQILVNNSELKNELKVLAENKSKFDEIVSQRDKLQAEFDVLKKQKVKSDNEVQDGKQEIASLKLIVQHLDTENKSFQRQVKRLTEENDQLINHLDVLGNQIREINKIKEGQQQQIKLLEEKSDKDAENVEKTTALWSTNFMSKVYDKITQIKDVTNTLNTEINTKDGTIEMLQNNIKDANNLAEESNEKVNLLQIELEETKIKNVKMMEDLKNYRTKLKKVYGEVKELKNNKSQLLQLIKEYSGYINDWQIKITKVYQQFYEENNRLRDVQNDIAKRDTEIKEKDELIAELQADLEKLQQATETSQNELITCKTDYEELKNQLAVSKREHVELLKEMNDMNQALKERGETISKQQEYAQELVRRLESTEQQKEKLEEQLEQSKHQEDDKDDVETASTSTVSRLDEVSRMRDLEGSWEERYTKLRTLALKLKAKVKEVSDQLAQERVDKSELQSKLTVAVKNLQTVQAEHDDLQDKYETLTKNNSKMENLLSGNNDVRQDMEKAVAELKACRKESGDLRLELQSLKKDLELEVDKKQQLEARVSSLESELGLKEKELALEGKRHKETRDKLEASNKECKKKSLLSLEMEDYEKSLKDYVQRLDKSNETIGQLQSKLELKEKSLRSLEEQLRLAEQELDKKEAELRGMETDLHETQHKLSEVEAVISQKENRIHEVIRSLEESRSTNEEMSAQLAQTIAQNQKVVDQLRSEKERLKAHVLGLEDRVRELTTSVEEQRQELQQVYGEYSSYKVRAQSVLRQSQVRDVGLEEKLQQEVDALQAQAAEQAQQLQAAVAEGAQAADQLATLERERAALAARLEDTAALLQQQRDEAQRLQHAQQQAAAEHREALRAHKLHTDTLAQCYKQQLAEQEERHVRQLTELRQSQPAAGRPDDVLDVSALQREQGEGSESVEAGPGASRHAPTPLDQLLDMDMDGDGADARPAAELVAELAAGRRQLAEQGARLSHLTELLAEAEQDLAKHAQLNQLLKEEIRRHQRSVEREQHADNLEYLKNVMLKFLTLGGGDERCRLVPVLNTILKLSPDEVKQLNGIARGDGASRGWGSYLPLWSGQQQ